VKVKEETREVFSTANTSPQKDLGSKSSVKRDGHQHGSLMSKESVYRVPVSQQTEKRWGRSRLRRALSSEPTSASVPPPREV
jgi:hypothetical protein